jgi:hypothetical protein
MSFQIGDRVLYNGIWRGVVLEVSPRPLRLTEEYKEEYLVLWSGSRMPASWFYAGELLPVGGEETP